MVRKLIGGNKVGVSGIYEPDENTYLVKTKNDLNRYTLNQGVSYSLIGNTGILDFHFEEDQNKVYTLDNVSRRIVQYNLSSDNLSLDYYNLDTYSHNFIETAPHDLFFRDDGTTMYLTGQSAVAPLVVGGDYVHQFSLTTAWDITTAGYSTSFSVTSQTSAPTGTFIGAAGTSMYVVGGTTIYQYTLGTAWNVSTASYASKTLSVSAKETTPTTLFFRDNGTSVYVTGTTSESIHQYTLSTAWDISTATFTSTFTISGDPNWDAMYIKPDGKRLYLIGSRDTTIGEYLIPVAWDISSINSFGGSFYQNRRFYSFADVPHGGLYRGIYFKPDGGQLFLNAATGNKVISVPLTTAWDIRSVNLYKQHFMGDVDSISNNNAGLTLKSDGTSAFTCSGNKICEFKLNSAWDITSIPDSLSYFSVNGQDTLPTDLFFKDDGTKVYIIGDTNNTIYQYSLSTAWDIYTASYDSKSFSVGTQDGNPTSLFFKSDGTKVYIVGDANNTIYQYSLGTAWDISTASYDSKSFSVNSQEGSPAAISFKDDGTKFYIVGSGSDAIFQYSLGTAWDISTASYDSKSFSVALLDSNSTGLFFKPDGTKVYVIGVENDAVYQFSLGTAWDISTASYDNKRLGVYVQESNPTGVFFKSDGTRIYFVGTAIRNIFSLDLSTAWDISSSSVQTYLIPSLPSNNSSSLIFKPDGTKVYVLDVSSIRQYSLTTAWDITSIIYDYKVISLRQYDTPYTGLSFSPDGTKIYVTGSGSDSVLIFFLKTPWDITEYFDSFYTNLFPANTRTGIFLSDDESKFYILSNISSVSSAIYEFSLSTPGKISTAGFTTSFSVGSQSVSPLGLSMGDSGTKFYIIGGSTIYQYSLGTAWNLSTASYDSKSFSVGTQDGVPATLFFKPDGTKVYITGNNTDTIYQYSLGTAWDISTASYDSNSFSVTTQETIPRGLSFSSDGTKVYVLGQIADRMFEYSLSTPWDISTASYTSNTYNFNTFLQDAYALFFKKDGSAFYIAGVGFFTFGISLPNYWDIRSAPNQQSGITPDSNYNFNLNVLDVGSKDQAPQGVSFNDDGTKLYVIGQTAVAPLVANSEYIHQYSVSTPWDIRTAGYTTSFSVTSQDTAPTDLFFKPDGTKVYITGDTTNTIYQYSLGTAWDISTASYDSKSFSVAGQDTIPTSLFFKPDGTSVYVLGDNGNIAFQYSLSIPWDISTATITNYTSVIGSLEAFANGMYIKPDGTKLYLTGSNTDAVTQLSLLVPWDISSIVSDGISLPIQGSGVGVVPTGLYFKPDGTKVYIIDDAPDNLYQYDLLEPWTLTTSRTKSLFVAGDTNAPTGVVVSEDLNKIYTSQTGKLYEYDFNP